MKKSDRPRLGRPLKDDEIEDLGDIELSDEEDARIQEKVEQAEKDIAARRQGQDMRFSCRWNKNSMAVIQEVADAMGVPYQTYVKMVAYRAAIADRNAMKNQVQESEPCLPPVPTAPLVDQYSQYCPACGDGQGKHSCGMPSQVAESNPPPPAPKKRKAAG